MAKQTVLLIDYEPRSIERFRQPLTEAGYAVEVATDGITGIEAFHRLNPDMVLVEAMIPKKHGFEVCQELKRTPHGRRTPILITTGVYKGRKYRTQALHIYGCDEYIEKPIAPEQLLAVVGRFFAGGAAAAPAATTSARVEVAAASADVTARGTVTATPASAEPAAARTTVPKASGLPTSVTKDFTEEEIMARLDAILPGGEIAGSAADAAPTAVLAPEVPAPLAPIALAPPSTVPVSELPLREEPFQSDPLRELPEELSLLDSAPAETGDPFAQMQAELTAELGSISAALALEPAPVFDEPLPSVPASHASSAWIPDALPLPSVPTPSTPSEGAPGGLPTGVQAPAPAETPGQLVNFDAKRSRRKKPGRKGADRRETSPSSATAQPAAPPLAQPKPAAQPPAAETLTLPPGTLVESDLGEPVRKKGVPVWIWATVAVAALVAGYFLLLRGSGNPSQDEPASSVLPSGTTARSPHRPESGHSSASDPSAAAPATEASTSAEAPLVLNSVSVPPPTPARPGPGANEAASRSTGVPSDTEPARAAGSAPVEPLPPPPTTTAKKNTAKPASTAAASSASGISSWHASSQNAPAKAAPGASPPAAAPDAVTGVETTAVEAVPADELVTRPSPAVETAIAPGTLVDESDLDTAPVSLSRKAPTYSMQARQLRVQGTVVMKVLVNERGTVDQVVLVEGVPGADLNASAMNAAKSWTYRPGTKGGVPVKVWKIEQVAFKL